MFNPGDKVRVKDTLAGEAGYEGIILTERPSNGDDVLVKIIRGRSHFNMSYNYRHLELVEPGRDETSEVEENALAEALDRHTAAMLLLVKALDEHSHQMSVFEPNQV